MSTDPIVSTGRGGAGNIGPDPTVYTDGEIVREGIQGQPDVPGKEYSTGRGGAGNIGSPRLAPQTGESQPRKSQDVVPETALRNPGAGYENYHTGRGGEGNVHREKYDGHSGPQHEAGKKEGLGEKVKHLLHLDGHKKEGTE
ncbi:hypothetical protein MPH_00486 [Macrophomina phaseolina MS6]|uniref:Uncharacterized protein n=2 Tax=Macrophomina phaseolina TaxID=35725 RepID=K2SI63_MACPH|nr:hypothetical protein MPH_00486 [Macrophomina phaseolina MS6]KAH7060775.1 hypothetical protein B0J12DRAFT_708505 [Macrophomina phaseolina]